MGKFFKQEFGVKLHLLTLQTQLFIDITSSLLLTIATIVFCCASVVGDILYCAQDHMSYCETLLVAESFVLFCL